MSLYRWVKMTLPGRIAVWVLVSTALHGLAYAAYVTPDQVVDGFQPGGEISGKIHPDGSITYTSTIPGEEIPFGVFRVWILFVCFLAYALFVPRTHPFPHLRMGWYR